MCSMTRISTNTCVSIIIPTLNSSRFLEACLKSVVSQSYGNWEALVVDGGSTDGTLDVIESFSAMDSRVKCVSNPNDQGPGQARALGIEVSQGTVIAFLDADDLWAEDKLDKQLRFMARAGAKFSFTSYKLISEKGKLSKASLNGWNRNTFKQYLGRRGIANSTVMIERGCFPNEIFTSTGNFLAEDTLWWLWVMRAGFPAYSLKEPLVMYRKVSGSRSSQIVSNQSSVWRIYRKEFQLSRLAAGWYYGLYAIDVLIRRALFTLRNGGLF